MKQEESLVRQVALKRLKEDIVLEDEEGKIIINRKGMKHMPFNDGSFIVIKDFDGLTADMFDGIVRAISDFGLHNCAAVVVRNLSDIRALDDEQMERHGWIRKQES